MARSPKTPLVIIDIPKFIRPASLWRVLNYMIPLLHQRIEINISDISLENPEQELTKRESPLRGAPMIFYRQINNKAAIYYIGFILHHAAGVYLT